MKNTSTKNSKSITVSVKDFKKHMTNGSLGYHFSYGSINTYACQIRKVISIYGEPESEFLKLDPHGFSALINLISEEQENHEIHTPAQFNVLTSSMKCYEKYLNLKYSEVIENKKSIPRALPLKKCDNQNCKSLLWKILNAFGLLKYI